jgi:Leucine Rich repeat
MRQHCIIGHLRKSNFRRSWRRDFVSFNPVLETFTVSYNPDIGPDGALGLGQGLARNDHLQCVEMQICTIGNSGLVSLVRGSRQTNLVNTTTTRLDLGGNDISDFNGGAYVGLLLHHFTALQDIGLSHNEHIDWLGLGVHLKARSLVLTKLDLSNCNMRNLGMLELLPVGETNESVTDLNLSSNAIQGAAGGDILGNVLTRFPNVRSLILRYNPLGPAGLHQLVLGLQEGRRFTRFELSVCDLEGGGVESLTPPGAARMSVTDLVIWNRFAMRFEILAAVVLLYFTNVDKISFLGGIPRTSRHENARQLVMYLQQQHWQHVSVSSVGEDACMQTLTESIRISDNFVE